MKAHFTLALGIGLFLGCGRGAPSNPDGGDNGSGGRVGTGGERGVGGRGGSVGLGGGGNGGGQMSEAGGHGGMPGNGGMGGRAGSAAGGAMGGSYACGSDTCVVGQSFCYSFAGGIPDAGIYRYCLPVPATCLNNPHCTCVCPTPDGGGFGCAVSGGVTSSCSCFENLGQLSMTCAGA